jgi:hypothetical protein
MISRPSETLTATIGTIVGAMLVILGSYTGLEVSTEVSGAVVTVISWVAFAVTWFVARRQRAGDLTSAVDGKVS